MYGCFPLGVQPFNDDWERWISGFFGRFALAIFLFPSFLQLGLGAAGHARRSPTPAAPSSAPSITQTTVHLRSSMGFLFEFPTKEFPTPYFVRFLYIFIQRM